MGSSEQIYEWSYLFTSKFNKYGGIPIVWNEMWNYWENFFLPTKLLFDINLFHYIIMIIIFNNIVKCEKRYDSSYYYN